jgi:pilus assembly protein CpaF
MSGFWSVKSAKTDAATSAPTAESTAVAVQATKTSLPPTDHMLALKVSIHRALLDKINLNALDQMSRAQIELEVKDLVLEILDEEKSLLNARERQVLVSEVLDELLGLGPIEPLLKDQSITDILINGPESVYVERGGLLEKVGTRFQDDKHLQRIIQKIVSAVGRRVDESSPYVDARLPDGSRVNAIIAPLAIDGSSMSIRKFSKRKIGMDRLIELDSVSEQMGKVLHAVVGSRRNVLISGGTGSGKTTLLNALSFFIDSRERIVTIEDSAELQLQQDHVVRLETRPSNLEGKGEVSQRDLVKNSLRMRPDRIIVGEVRAGEAFDMLQAMNTGHDGSMTTVHANSPRDSLSRLEQMIGMSGIEISPSAARSQIASAINVVIQVSRMVDGHRRVTSIAEVTGMESDVISMQEIFRYRITGREDDGKVQGFFEATGIRPKFLSVAADYGIQLDSELFRPGKRV